MGKIFIKLVILYFTIIPAYSAIKGSIDYKIPIDYTKLNQTELEACANDFYTTAIISKNLDENMTSALILYTILTNKSPSNISYALKLGKLYDVIGKDRYAKGNYYHAMGLEPKNPEPYKYLGDYFYDREQYKKALKFYNTAYDKGFSNNYETLYKMGDIYQKFGDTQNSLKFLEAANEINFNEELTKKINTIKNNNSFNKEYYK